MCRAMHEFAVWAPNARKASVKVDNCVYPMSGPNGTGWWRAVVKKTGNGTDYAFLLNDDPTPYPDPRSPWQPNGVHGASRLYDHTAFTWNDDRWLASPLASAVIYELHLGTFTA